MNTYILLCVITAAFFVTWYIIGWHVTSVRGHVHALKKRLEAQKQPAEIMSLQWKDAQKEALKVLIREELFEIRSRMGQHVAAISQLTKENKSIRDHQENLDSLIEELKADLLELTGPRRGFSPIIVPKNEKPAPQRVQEFLEKKGPSKRIEIIRETKISKTHVSKVLKELAAAGVIEKTEEKTYKLKEKI